MKLTWVWIIIDEKNRIFLAKRSNYTNTFPWFWNLPWWRWDLNETAEQIVIREVKEEIWLDFEPTRLFHDCITQHSWIDVLSSRFLWKYSWKITIQEEEIDWYAWYSYEEIKDLKIAFNHMETIEMLKEEWLI